MSEVSVIGIDLAKNVFQLCALSASGEIVWQKRLSRDAVQKFLDTEPRCLIGMEACGGAHHWARWLIARGYTVKLIAPRTVKAYRTSVHKNDGRDARATAEAASRAHVASVSVKSEATQATQALTRVRERMIRQLTQTANQLRGLMHEFGIVLPRGSQRMLVRLNELQLNGRLATLPAAMREMVQTMSEEIVEQAGKVKAATAALEAAVKQDAACQLFRSIPNIGPINAAGLAVALETPQAFAKGRSFAAALRLVPQQAASAETNKLLGVGKMRNCELRRYLVLAAQSLLTRVSRMKQRPDEPLLGWAWDLLQRKTRNVAVVAVAAKFARIAWAVASSGKPYTPGGPRARGAVPAGG